MSNEQESNSHRPEFMEFNTLPNFLTLFRMLCVPILILMLLVRSDFWDTVSAFVFGIASLTDYFDGYLARKRDEVTIYGKLLDPLADKFLVVSSLILLQYIGKIHPVVVIVLTCRELAITGLRALASAEGVIIPASASAKWKTASQMVAIPFIMAPDHLWGIPWYVMGMTLLYVSLAISLWSAREYILNFFKLLKERRLKKKSRSTAKESP